jgi:hypothetical protein
MLWREDYTPKNEIEVFENMISRSLHLHDLWSKNWQTAE